MQRLLKSAVLSVTLLALGACSTSPNDRSLGVAVNDATLSTKIKAALAADPEVKATDVQVETYRGTVQLSGFVDSAQSANRAIDIARRTDGVRDVKSALIVK